ncbi:hypothetical protein CAOG_07321 [Capsaspora owczarzaki ATCC 30864]|uniref:Signal peptidase complex subunit 3 n=1 Tax=Capsaspora owczarzaki (strain ATCC 30864) TaxID=595528 RepID=A0A0D2UR25_CAPO3|nr:hypothetical protein CAOG_07321 [Capsaspora owczarzaki ATCC 30864]KJE97466.1 hypothetical protein CAOG_007321 [Capsaspora owczarzaki ATCC 30864]|eukprot:XP_004343180.1 hypothetical protein CAOG_07321 [Capsaspora owczarzaki ATCC 30864]
MHSAFQRINTLSAFSVSVLTALAIGCFLTSYMYSPNANPEVDVRLLQLRTIFYFDQSVDVAALTFDLHADFSSVMNWSTHVVFIYLTAEYETQNNRVNQVVVWDKILQQGDNPVLNYKEQPGKYGLFDDGTGLRGNKNVTLSLHWNVIPLIGSLPRFSGGHRQVSFPQQDSL